MQGNSGAKRHLLTQQRRVATFFLLAYSCGRHYMYSFVFAPEGTRFGNTMSKRSENGTQACCDNDYKQRTIPPGGLRNTLSNPRDMLWARISISYLSEIGLSPRRTGSTSST